MVCEKTHFVRVGDCVKQGRYRFHSSFSHVRNFVSGSSLVSLVSKSVGESGTNIVWLNSQGEIPSGDVLEISSEGVSCGQIFVPQQAVSRFESNWAPRQAKLCRTRLALAGSYVPQKGFSFLLRGEPPSSSCGAFELALAEAARGAQRLLDSGNLFAGARAMRGLGMGLTPSGDDYLCGVLSAYAVMERISKRDMSRERAAILEGALGGNVFSNAFLQAAAKGSFSLRQKNFFDAVFGDESSQCAGSVEALANVGASSGTDFLVGFLHTMERESVL
jgi:hypothetical protein